jgi:CubicO group peptidase (beta-lactamase class C family)
MKILKIAGIVIGIIILILLIVAAFAWYKARHVRDTHDLKERINKLCYKHISTGQSVGLFVGVIQGNEEWMQGYGSLAQQLVKQPDSSTVFEIGSVSKVFTTAITQMLVDKGELSWDDPIARYIPATAGYKDDSTTLRHLAAHLSGFPRIPQAWFSKIEANECDPYSVLTMDDLLGYLRNDTDKKKPSMKGYDYSNVGTGLLGHILEWKTGKTYEALLQEYIAGPLHMAHTTMADADSAIFATGHNEQGKPTCHWHMPILPGAGAIRASGSDMMVFLKAAMNGTGPVGATIARTQKEVASMPGGAIAHGWHIDRTNGAIFGIKEIVWHNGGTGGFRSYIGFIPEKKTGIVILSNQASEELDRLAISMILRANSISLK